MKDAGGAESVGDKTLKKEMEDLHATQILEAVCPRLRDYHPLKMDLEDGTQKLTIKKGLRFEGGELGMLKNLDLGSPAYMQRKEELARYCVRLLERNEATFRHVIAQRHLPDEGRPHDFCEKQLKVCGQPQLEGSAEEESDAPAAETKPKKKKKASKRSRKAKSDL